MPERDLLKRVISITDPSTTGLHLLRKNGRVLLGLAGDSEAAAKTLRLYQPQRSLARVSVRLLQIAISLGLQKLVLPRIPIDAMGTALEPPFPEVIEGSCGILIGSPEHRVRRTIASYQTPNGWEVAKIAFGPESWDVIHGEASVLLSLPENTAGAPGMLALHRGPDISLMRMPYIEGEVLHQGESAEAIAILNAWFSELPPKPMNEFPEWPLIQSALLDHPKAAAVTKHLSQKLLRPTVRHGDFARWNLLRTSEGKIMVVDWEMGAASGMPGIDLVHFFAQDARLVNRLPAAEVVQSMFQSLQAPECRAYLEKSGWGNDTKEAMIASLAFSIGTKEQASEEVLDALLQSWQ